MGNRIKFGVLVFTSTLVAAACGESSEHAAVVCGTGGIGGAGSAGHSAQGGTGMNGGGEPSDTPGGSATKGRESSGGDGAGARGDAGAQNQGGFHHTSEQLTLCGSRPLPDGVYCSAEAACEALECGAPWSLFDANGCARRNCSFGNPCPTGQRCVPAIVAGAFERACFREYDRCDDSRGSCSCHGFYWNEADGTSVGGCLPLAVCLPEPEFSAEHDCPIDGLNCDQLRLADTNLYEYLKSQFEVESGLMPAENKAMVQSCLDRVEARLFACH
jgi:hypothetical protein